MAVVESGDVAELSLGGGVLRWCGLQGVCSWVLRLVSFPAVAECCCGFGVG
jgi:hypothetical protein